MKKSVTIRDIAKAAGVSVATVSRCINSSGYVDSSTSKRISKTINELGYRPNRMAQGLKTNISKNVTFIVPDIQNPFYSSMARGLQHFAFEAGYSITLFDSEEDIEYEKKYIKLSIDMGVDGIILASASNSQSVLALLEDGKTPSVLLNSYDRCGFDTVHGIRGQSTYLATKHLIELGHSKIGFAGGIKGRIIANSRRGGYTQAMEEFNLPIYEEDIIEMGLSVEDGRKCARYYSTLEEKPTAICCVNDLVAMGMMQTFIQLGYRVPEDFSLTGVDNILYTELSDPRLTSVTNDSNQFAQKAMEALLERISGQYTGDPREFMISRELIVRDSAKRINE